MMVKFDNSSQSAENERWKRFVTVERIASKVPTRRSKRVLRVKGLRVFDLGSAN